MQKKSKKGRIGDKNWPVCSCVHGCNAFICEVAPPTPLPAEPAAPHLTGRTGGLCFKMHGQEMVLVPDWTNLLFCSNPARGRKSLGGCAIYWGAPRVQESPAVYHDHGGAGQRLTCTGLQGTLAEGAPAGEVIPEVGTACCRATTTTTASAP